MTTPRLQQMISAAFDTHTPTPRDTGVVSCELMVHPGYPCAGVWGCGDGADDFSKSADRMYEKDIITGNDLLQWYENSSIELVSHLI